MGVDPTGLKGVSQESMSSEESTERLRKGGPPYYVPVDTEHKSLTLRMYELRSPHIRAFWLSTLAFFSAFVSTFAAAGLLPVIRNNLDLVKADVGNAGVASVCGAILARVAMGSFVDTFGSRYGISLCLGGTSPAVFAMAMVNSATGFILARFFIGFSLATFVACQFWCSNMFNTKIVGTANAFAAGWGNMGGGFAALIMPLVYQGIVDSGVFPFQAWRWAFFFPGGLAVVLTVTCMLLAQDMPDGQYRDLKKSGAMAKGGGGGVWKAALTNYRTYIMLLCYGYCFGVELTIDNVLPEYLFDQFNLDITIAGLLGSIFGMMNLFTRATGGIVSDVAGRYYGMRGRLWSLWIGQTLGGLFCLILGLPAIHATLGATMGIVIVFSVFCQMSCGLAFGVVPFVSKRALGLVSGFTGAGGNAGGAITQAAFFTSAAMSTEAGFVWTGVLTMAITLLYTLVYFPMWGGMFMRAKPGVTEEDYYMSEFSPEERAQGMHTASLKFAYESRSQRGHKSHQQLLAAEAANAGTLAFKDPAKPAPAAV